MNTSRSTYQNRRAQLIQEITKNHPGKRGIVFLHANFEHSYAPFRQEGSFYYLSGILEPAVALVADLTGKSTLYIPLYEQPRTAWMHNALTLESSPQSLGVDAITGCGKPGAGYHRTAVIQQDTYAHLVGTLKKHIEAGEYIFTIAPHNPNIATEQQLLLTQLAQEIPHLHKHIIDISPLIARMRRTKQRAEIGTLFQAVELTMVAHEAAARSIKPGESEQSIQAGIEYIFTDGGARTAFPSIVVSGNNSTILHYHDNSATLKAGDLVVVDIGAQYNYYCADLTRTYPVSGKFSKRQREVYEIVRATQSYIANLAKPGMWLRNAQNPDKSLHHLAVTFLKERGYDKYFMHGIGHFLGIDVHDVGDYTEPLADGDVITIEPGIYIPEESIGIRIEDNYWITKNGAECLSHELPSDPNEIEEMMRGDLDEE